MKFKDSNGVEKEHAPLKDRLLLLGFDEHMLIKDDSLIQILKEDLIVVLEVFPKNEGNY